MKLKMVGLGKMGLNLALNMKEHGVDVEGFDVNEEARKKAESENIKTYASLEDAVSKDEKNVIWVMLPAGKITNSVLNQLVELCKANDIVIDGGNSDHRDSLKTAHLMEEKGIYFFDIGTSGGVYGARHGASFMCGGDPDVFKKELQEMLESIATTNGCLYTGKTGSGHYLKMIHNAMLYGYMQTLGEGFELLEKSEFDYDLQNVADSLSKSSVIRGWLLELAADAFKKDPDLSKIKGVVGASKTTGWTIESACELGVPIPVISTSLMMRLRSKQDDSFSAKVIASLRDEVGGHKAQSK
ncbi:MULTISPECIES: phosphogluconate dehydrogenase (NAD(+)-dependent, decarboxylating) [Holdemanella]|jgi:6-phosphogluconate dehydrogenase|uniref:phosphogluconate dehydrogenase (NAD(+)-dependent, decarboxylating) n=1 Tax=Holdemanella TaxID=1573535 RepID=UPI00241C3449|nr:decarboxylating 6-phosphogluconate dehydrogenase [Holdemanella sp.]MEE0079910.1 decarboxylating 6-phosphogluconate dehydrogenase [Holdemanella sp.]